ncbi:hypothetical protein EC960932_2882, partial [Escherichia coli 96.0932]|jgi:hypothetical protein
MEIL